MCKLGFGFFIGIGGNLSAAVFFVAHRLFPPGNEEQCLVHTALFFGFCGLLVAAAGVWSLVDLLHRKQWGGLFGVALCYVPLFTFWGLADWIHTNLCYR